MLTNVNFVQKQDKYVLRQFCAEIGKMWRKKYGNGFGIKEKKDMFASTKGFEILQLKQKDLI